MISYCWFLIVVLNGWTGSFEMNLVKDYIALSFFIMLLVVKSCFVMLPTAVKKQCGPNYLPETA